MLTDTNEPILAIDPGPKQSGWVIYDGVDALDCGIDQNENLRRRIYDDVWFVDLSSPVHLAIERVMPYRGKARIELIETAVWVGRFGQEFGWDDVSLIARPVVCEHLCGHQAAKKPKVRKAIINRYGGTRQAAIGLKQHPGPLYGITDHIWDALAVAITYWETRA